MKTLMLAASALTLIAAPAHAQLLGGGGLSGVTGSINGTVNSTLRAPSETLRSTTRGTLRGDASTRGKQNVDRENGNVSIDRSLDTNLDATTSQLIGTPAGEASGNSSGSANASGSGNANAQLIGTSHVTGAVHGVAGKARETASTVRNVATPAVGSARERLAGAAGQAGSVAGSANGAGTGSGMIDSGILALAGSGAAQGEGAFSVAPGMPVHLPSGQQLGKVRDIVATRSGEIRDVVVEKKDGLATIPASQLTASGTALIAGEATASAAKNAPAEASDAE
ncbi:hypothetical protein [Qipengyuania nanhaisediminis]|uniref:PRC-barrel domain-containing protein n=1 Tax=Qipengyuania nanhaisediminis TaxID=604088 RepID=A0A1I5PC68_9SPHN|nr:hypothetical protein [Qipengyuania nanhaisediminis]SFP31699.1 hypothetical protein SAMN04488060_2312 [Qipengyuania nanhaisediminis]